MSTTHVIQTVIEVLFGIAILVGLVYEPVIAKWEHRQGEFKEHNYVRKNAEHGNLGYVDCFVLFFHNKNLRKIKMCAYGKSTGA